MADAGQDWAARLRRTFAELPGPAAGTTGAPEAAPAPPSAEAVPALARELAEERAAIMTHDGGLPDRQAEALAYAAHGLPAPDATSRKGV